MLRRPASGDNDLSSSRSLFNRPGCFSGDIGDDSFNGGGCSVLRNTYQADSVYMLKDFIRWKSSVYFITDDLRQMTREMPRAIGSDRGSARV